MGSEGGKILELEVFSLLLCCSFCFLFPSVSFFVSFFFPLHYFSQPLTSLNSTHSLSSHFSFTLLFLRPLRPRIDASRLYPFFWLAFRLGGKGKGLFVLGCWGGERKLEELRKGRRVETRTR